MTDNHGGAAKPRASTRSARANQERKEILEAAQALPLAPEAAAAGLNSSHVKPREPTAEAAASGETIANVASDEVADDHTSTRRSARRAVTKPQHPSAGAGSASPTTETDESAAEEAVAPPSDESKPASAEAVAEFVTNGGTLAAAATRFGISRAEVTKIVKETTIPSGASASAPKHSAPVASGKDTMQDKDQAIPSTNHAATEDDAAATHKEPSTASATAQSESTKTQTDVAALHQSLQVSSAADHTNDAPMNLANDLKRSADALADVGSDTGVGGSGSAVPKAKRVRKTREEKLAILAFVDDGGTHVAAAEKFGVSRTAVTKMVKEREIIMSGITGKQHAVANGAAPAVALPGASYVHTAAAPALLTASSSASAGSATRKTRAATSTASVAAARPQQTGDGAPHPKAKRVRKTNEEKLMILEFVERGGSQGAAAEKFGVSRTAVTKMVKEREAITAQVMSGKSNHRKVLQYQHKLSIIEDMLYKWQVQVENDAPNLKITGDLLQSKAVEFRDKILTEWKGSLEPEVVQSLSDFKASNGWLHRYLQRRNLRTASKREYHRRAGANGGGTAPQISSDALNVNIFVGDITERLRAVPVQCIWNMDELALLPKTFVSPAMKESGEGSQAADRLTVALMVNAAGEKFKPQVVISESLMEKVDPLQKALSSVHVTAQQNAWQDTTALALYLHAVSSEAKQRVETWYIVMDASPSHLEFAQLVDPAGSFEQGYRFESLVLLLLPPHAALELQPIHHGISRVFKAAYRQSMLTALVQKWIQLAAADTTTGARFNLHSQVDALEELGWVSQAWDAVPGALIRHCWVRNGLLSSPQLAQISQDNSRAVEAELFRSLSDTLTSISEQGDGALARALGLPVLDSSSSPSLLDQVNALITLDDNEPTERKIDINAMSSTTSHVITETDANGDLRALV